MKKLLLLCSIVLLVGCKTAPITPQPIPASPIEVAGHQETSYDVPLLFTFDQAPAGWDKDKVATYNIPPSTKATKLIVRPAPTSLGNKLFPKKNAPVFEAITNNDQVTGQQAPSTPWWYWFLLILLLVIVLLVVLSLIQKRFAWAGTLFRWIMRIRQ